MVAKSGDDMHGRLKIQDDSKKGNDAVLKVITGTAPDQPGGGLIVKGNGQISAMSGSKSIVAPEQLATKAYVDGSIEAGVDDKFLELEKTDNQVLHSKVYFKNKHWIGSGRHTKTGDIGKAN